MLAQCGSRTRGIVGQMLWVVAGWLAAGCSSQDPVVMVQLPAAGAEDAVGPSFDVNSCQHYPQSTEIDRVCMIDSNGRTYPENGTLWVLPAAPPYAVYYQFKPGYTPAPQDVDSTSDTSSIGTFAAPYDVTNPQGPCCSEDDPANRVFSHATLTPSGGLLVSITDAQPLGDQLSVILSNFALYRSRVDPCTLPDPSACQWVYNSGFAVRFYVGSGPKGSVNQPPRPPSGSKPPVGACLLEYNDALVSTGTDTCCYHQGGANNCHTITQCNDAAGAGCCLVYGTDNTAGGGRCCLYESGDFGDDATECQELLAAH